MGHRKHCIYHLPPVQLWSSCSLAATNTVLRRKLRCGAEDVLLRWSRWTATTHYTLHITYLHYSIIHCQSYLYMIHDTLQHYTYRQYLSPRLFRCLRRALCGLIRPRPRLAAGERASQPNKQNPGQIRCRCGGGAVPCLPDNMTPHKWQQVPAAAAHMSPLCPGCKQLFHRSSIYTHDETREMTIYLDHFTFCDNCDLFSGEINFLCNNFNSSQFTEVWLLFPVVISFHLTRIKLPLSLPTSYTLTS